MTLGSAAKAHLVLIAWCKDCRHQAAPELAEMAKRYGADVPMLDWSKRLVCSQCGSLNVDRPMHPSDGNAGGASAPSTGLGEA